jgi:hypothetical protein
MNLSILVGTCDDYLEFMPNSMALMDRYLPDELPRIVAGETQAIEHPNYEWCLPGKGAWGKRMVEALQKVKTDYVFFTLDDYYYSQKLTKEFFDWLLVFMEREKADKLCLTPVPSMANYQYTETVDTIKRMAPYSNWLTSVQPAIWRTEHLLRLMHEEYSPWSFEVEGSEKARHQEKNHYVIKLDEPVYFNFVRQGKCKTIGWEKFLEQEGLA